MVSITGDFNKYSICINESEGNTATSRVASSQQQNQRWLKDQLQNEEN